MTWESQGPAAPQDPRQYGAQQPQGQMPPPGYPQPGQQPPPPGYPQPGQQPPPPYAVPGSDPWIGQQQPPPPPPPPPGQQPPGWGPQQPMWMPPPAYPLAPDAYAVNVSYDRGARINRLWGIPILGQLVRYVLLIPHFIVIVLLAIMATLQFLVSWIAVLALGRYPGWGYRWTGGLLAYVIRVGAYAMLMTSAYPPFSLSAEMYPVSVRFDEGVRINRLWGIPVIGYFVRGLILIPHFIVLWLLGIVVWFLAWFVWVPVLILGRQADLIYTLLGGFYRWELRISAYFLLMVDRYPPFSLGEDDPRL
jgi:Domain of unknown function (DUF4389)